MIAIDYLGQALHAERHTFLRNNPYLFLLGSTALQRPERPDATVAVDLDTTEETYEVTRVGGPSLRPPEEKAAPATLLLAVRKVQPTFPAMITIGRTSNHDIVISDKSVSKFHAYFKVPPEGLRFDVRAVELCDAGSRNGTWVSGRQLYPKLTMQVRVGEVIRFANVKLTLVEAGQAWDRLHEDELP